MNYRCLSRWVCCERNSSDSEFVKASLSLKNFVANIRNNFAVKWNNLWLDSSATVQLTKCLKRLQDTNVEWEFLIHQTQR